MYRKITIFLEYWKNSKHRKPLILQGTRQVGKTYSVLEFGRTHYENTVYFNFDTNPKLKQTFDEYISPELNTWFRFFLIYPVRRLSAKQY